MPIIGKGSVLAAAAVGGEHVHAEQAGQNGNEQRHPGSHRQPHPELLAPTTGCTHPHHAVMPVAAPTPSPERTPAREPAGRAGPAA